MRNAVTTSRVMHVVAVSVCLLAALPNANAGGSREEPVAARDWSVSLTVGVPEITALRVSHRFGPRWRLSGDLGGVMMIFSGGLHANRVLAWRGATSLYAGLSASAVWNSGCGYDYCGEATLNWGVGPHLGAEWTHSTGIAIGIEAGALAGRWPDFYETDRHVLPLVMVSAGYSW